MRRPTRFKKIAVDLGSVPRNELLDLALRTLHVNGATSEECRDFVKRAIPPGPKSKLVETMREYFTCTGERRADSRTLPEGEHHVACA